MYFFGGGRLGWLRFVWGCLFCFWFFGQGLLVRRRIIVFDRWGFVHSQRCRFFSSRRRDWLSGFWSRLRAGHRRYWWCCRPRRCTDIHDWFGLLGRLHSLLSVYHVRSWYWPAICSIRPSFIRSFKTSGKRSSVIAATSCS